MPPRSSPAPARTDQRLPAVPPVTAREALDELGESASAPRATLEFGLRHEQAVLDWFDILPGVLPRGEP